MQCRRITTNVDSITKDSKRVIVHYGSTGVDEYGHAKFFNDGNSSQFKYDDATWYLGYGSIESPREYESILDDDGNIMIDESLNELGLIHMINWKLDRAPIGSYFVRLPLNEDELCFYKKLKINGNNSWVLQDVTELALLLKDNPKVYMYDSSKDPKPVYKNGIIYYDIKNNYVTIDEDFKTILHSKELLTNGIQYLSPNDLQLQFNKYNINRNDNYAKTQEAVANSLNQRLSVLQGELWYATTNGWPIFSNPNKLICDTYLIETILEHPSVIFVDYFKSSIYNHTYSAYLEILTVYGKTSIELSK